MGRGTSLGKQSTLTWDGEARGTTTISIISSGLPQGSPQSPVLFLIAVAKAFEDADIRISTPGDSQISRLGTSRGGLSPTVWRQMYTGSIRVIATYGWGLGHTDTAMERLQKLQYKAVRKVTGGYHGARQTILENITKVEPVEMKLWDMRQDNLIENVERYSIEGPAEAEKTIL